MQRGSNIIHKFTQITTEIKKNIDRPLHNQYKQRENETTYKLHEWYSHWNVKIRNHHIDQTLYTQIMQRTDQNRL